MDVFPCHGIDGMVVNLRYIQTTPNFFIIQGLRARAALLSGFVVEYKRDDDPSSTIVYSHRLQPYRHKLFVNNFYTYKRTFVLKSRTSRVSKIVPRYAQMNDLRYPSRIALLANNISHACLF